MFLPECLLCWTGASKGSSSGLVQLLDCSSSALSQERACIGGGWLRALPMERNGAEGDGGFCVVLGGCQGGHPAAAGEK